MEMAERMVAKGVYATAFLYPVVPGRKAWIRTQMSTALSKAEIGETVQGFQEVREEENGGAVRD